MLPIFWIFSFIALAYILWICIERRNTLKLVTLFPYPPTLPFFGHALMYTGPSNVLDLGLEICNKYGSPLRVSAVWREFIILFDPKHVEEVLGTSKLLHKSSMYRFLDRWLGTGLLTAKPDKWKKTRKILTPAFHFQILEDFVDVFNSCGDIMVEKLKAPTEKSTTDIYEYVTLCTLDIICESTMGTKVNAQLNSSSKYVTSVQQISKVIRDRVISLKMIDLFFYLSGDYISEKRALKVLHNYTDSLIQTRRKELSKGPTIGNDFDDGKKKRLAFLDLLLQSTIDGRPLTDREIRDEVDTFMFEGHDTTASAISSTLYCLANDHEVQNKAVGELRTIFEDNPTRQATYADLQNMRYLDMIIKEALRLYPPVPIYGRVVDQCTVLGGDKVLPKGVEVAIFVWALHRDPNLYPDPEKFDPERFTLENQNARNPFSYVAFSAGNRNCIGQRFAMLEMKSVIAKVLLNFELLPVRDFKPVWVPDLVLKSVNGVQICLRERLS